MSETIVVELPGAPKGKGRPRFRRFKRFVVAYTPPETRKFEDALKVVARKAMAGRNPLLGAIELVVTAYMPIPESWSKKKKAAALDGSLRPKVKPDWENIGKTLDAFNKLVWHDDSAVVDGRVVKWYSDKPRLHIELREIPG